MRNMKIARILVPLDFEEPCQAAADLAASVANDYGAEVIFVHVFDREAAIAHSETGYYTPIDAETIEGMHADIKALLAKAETAAQNKGVKTSSRAYYGRPSEVIPALAKEFGVDLIVMGSHGRTGVSRVMVGSVTEEVLRHTQIPTLVIHP